MKIVFDKIGSTPKPIQLSLDGVLLEGTLEKSSYHRVTLDAQMSGNVELICDRCADTFDYDLSSRLRLKLSDLVSEDKDDLDIIEFLDGVIDITYIVEGEINAHKSAYHYCDNCDNDDEEFEIEF